MSPSQSKQSDLLTAKEIAEKLASMGVALKAIDVSRMIGHYTSQGILTPLGPINTGTGRSRLYARDAFLEAAVLFRLSALGIPVGVMKQLFKGLHAHLKARHSGRT